ncbi:YihY/virulence factor BrkB family protein [bacterium]|nr:YihY/virulence factor BrkB family protein [bacterium]
MKWLRIYPLLLRKRLKAFKPTRVVCRAAMNFYKDDGFTFSAAISFYFLLSFLPFLMLMGALTGIAVNVIQNFYSISTEQLAQQIVAFIRTLMPYLKEHHLEKFFMLKDYTLSLGFIGTIAIIIAATLLFSTLHYALYKIFGGNFLNIVRSRALGILFMLTLTLFAFALHWFISFASLIAGELSLLWPPLQTWLTFFEQMNFFSIILSVILLFTLFHFLLFFFTSGIIHNQKVVFFGAVVFSTLWIGAKWAYDFYLSTLSSLNLIYGSLAYIVSIVLWVYYSALLLLLSMELINAIYEEWSPVKPSSRADNQSQ